VLADEFRCIISLLSFFKDSQIRAASSTIESLLKSVIDYLFFAISFSNTIGFPFALGRLRLKSNFSFHSGGYALMILSKIAVNSFLRKNLGFML
jgi:hypothetical protein